MVCKNCGAFLSDDLKDCPVCGAIIGEEAEGSESNTVGETFISPDADDDVDVKPKKKKTNTIVIVALSVLLVVAIVFCVLLSVDGLSGKIKNFFSDVFSSSDTNDRNNPNDIVAEFMGEQLNNVKLNYYYYDVYETFSSMYGDQLEAVITYVLQDGETMEDFLVECAINEWANNVALKQMATKDNFILSTDEQAQIDSMISAINEAAVTAGFANSDAFIKSLYGKFSSSASYLEHYQDTTYAYMYKMDYFNEKYDEYLDDLDGLDTFNYSVRHILFQPADTSKDADWKDAENKANEIYQQWLKGEATEESFGELAKEHSSDGSAVYGGLYEDIPEGYMVQPFNDWCLDKTRKPGDHGIVKTEFGYHIMYFVSFVNPDAYDTANNDLSNWITAAKNGQTPVTYLDKVTINAVEK